MHKNVVKLEVLSLEGSRYATLEKGAMQFSDKGTNHVFGTQEGTEKHAKEGSGLTGLNQLRHINDLGEKSFGRSVKGYLGVIWGDFSFFFREVQLYFSDCRWQ